MNGLNVRLNVGGYFEMYTPSIRRIPGGGLLDWDAGGSIESQPRLMAPSYHECPSARHSAVAL